MNTAESAYSRILENRRAAGEIVWWAFEAVTLRIDDGRPADKATDKAAAKGVAWTPDFLVMYPDGALEFVDVKGTRPRDEQAERAKAKIAAGKFFMFRFIIAKQQRGHGWKIEEL